MWKGTLVSIHIADTAGAPMKPLRSVRAVAGKGLEGDRYCKEEGFYSWFRGPLREISLIEAEVLERLAQDHHIQLEPGETRRNLVTQGVPLGHLIGRTFRVGEVLLRGVEICEPCQHLVEVTGKKALLSSLIHRGGLHAQILTDGLLTIGDEIAPEA
ncbi:MOSC domain-containing protein [Thermosporothrix hazakensis]|uniref:MOSC domain-containing protein n=2 Tax=Thermosporothrix TaxID=768650 RepID=A0A326TYU0_THEHA|nr:MOSC domain-containing protein [Thermosporothrix hazakensis]